MGFEIIPFSDAKTLKTSEGNDIIVGYVNTVRSRLFDFGITAPEMDYPKKLEKYLGRRIWQTTMKNVSNNPTCWPVFVKPLEDK